jgi:hypothetical protein
MGAADAGINDVCVDAAPVAGNLEAAVERERALVDAVETPRHTRRAAHPACRTQDAEGAKDTNETDRRR